MDDLAEHANSYKPAFDERGRALDAQERAVNELRSRAGVLIAAAAITTAFFGSPAVTGGPITAAAWCATVAFALVAAASYATNAALLGKLYGAFRVGLVLLALEVSSWIVALGGQGSTRHMAEKLQPPPRPMPERPSPMQGETGRGNGSKKK